jgi:hypothetical protein
MTVIIINLLLVVGSAVVVCAQYQTTAGLGDTSVGSGNRPTDGTYGRGCRMVRVDTQRGQIPPLRYQRRDTHRQYDTRRAGGYPCLRPSRPWFIPVAGAVVAESLKRKSRRWFSNVAAFHGICR